MVLPQKGIVVMIMFWESEAVLSMCLHTVGAKYNDIYDVIIHVWELTLPGNFENSVVEDVNRLTIVLGTLWRI